LEGKTTNCNLGWEKRLRECNIQELYTKQGSPTVTPICGENDGLPRELDRITFPKWRIESVKAYGNAIVPQVAHQLFKTIQEFERLNN
jgi:hypothetical protein